MKKLILVFAAALLGMSSISLAQDKYVTSANVALNRGDFDEAKEDIDKAMQNPETAEKPKALFAKANIYGSLATVPKYQSLNPLAIAMQTLIKLAELKPDYEKATVDQALLMGITYYYNSAIKAYKETTPNHFDTAIDYMKTALKIYNLNDGKRFAAMKRVDSNKATGNLIIANSVYYSNRYEEAIPLLIDVKNNPITKSPTVFEFLINAYEKTKKTTEEEAAIKEGRAAFPDDEVLRNLELNYYITTGKQDDLLKKLEEAAAKDPNSADLQISLATAYSGQANPKTGKAPANKAEILAKAETAFQKAVTLAPDNAEFSYYFGVLYYNQAKEVNDQMNSVTGSSDADLKKFNDLKTKRDGLFEKAVPHIEKAYTLFDAKAASLKDDEKKVYISSMQALSNIYAMQSKMDKVAVLKKKIAETK